MADVLAGPTCSSGRRLDDAGQAHRKLQTSSVPYSVFLTALVETTAEGTSDKSSVTASMTALPTARTRSDGRRA